MAGKKGLWGLILAAVPILVGLVVGVYLVGFSTVQVIVGWVLVISAALGLVGWLASLISKLR